jgi:hypothetical protein
MKFNLTSTLFLLITIFTSCSSDELTKSKAESMAIECIKGENHVKTTTSYYGVLEQWDRFKKKNTVFLESYKKLEEKGLYNMGELQHVKGVLGMKERYEISLTPKAEKLLISSKKDAKGKITGKFKICEYTFESVEEIHEIPAENIANVKLKFIRINETPFFKETHEKANPKEVFKQVKYKKTNDGWKLCDKQ